MSNRQGSTYQTQFRVQTDGATSYVLIAIVKKELQRDASLYTCLQILSVSVFEKTELLCALQADGSQREPLDAANQLDLFNF